jgi:hypothetical protein
MVRRTATGICAALLILLALQQEIACRKPPPPPPEKLDIRWAPTKAIPRHLPPTPTLRPGQPTPLPDEPQ